MGGVNIGRLLEPFQGVPIFFTLSAFFIWLSLSKNRTVLPQYIKKRFLRIYPELWIVVLMSVIVVLLLYHENTEVIPFLIWILTQGTVLQLWTPDFFKGYGMGAPNGSLWTISIFVQFYVVVYIALLCYNYSLSQHLISKVDL